MSIDEIRSVVWEENLVMLQDTVQRLENMHAVMMERALLRLEGSHAAAFENAVQKLEKTLDERLAKQGNTFDEKLANQETRMNEKFLDIQKLAEQLELRLNQDNENMDPAAQEAKRRRRSSSMEPGTGGMKSNARDLADFRRHDEEERHTIVFTGFPAKSRKNLVIDYIKLQLKVVLRLAGYAEDFDLKDKIFTPSIRTNVAMLHLPPKKAMFGFLSAWNLAEETGQITRFGENESMIRAKRDKPPAIRKAHGKLWQLSVHFKSLGFGDVEIDWRSCSVWINDCEAVKWDMDRDEAVWMEQEMTGHNLQIYVAAAKLALNRPRNS